MARPKSVCALPGVPPDLPDDQYRDVLEQNAIGVELANNNIRIDGGRNEGDVGEILVRGPVVANGYLNQPKDTAEVFCNGWFRSGDMGYFRDIYGPTFLLYARAKKRNHHQRRCQYITYRR